MPVAIIITDKAIPAIIEEQTDEALLAAVNALAITPNGMNLETLKLWLNNRPRPGGWYRTRDEAIAEATKTANPDCRPILPLTPNEVRAARKKLGMTKVEFGKALGFNGNHNTVNKAVYEIEHNKHKGLRRDKQEVLFGLLTGHQLANKTMA